MSNRPQWARPDFYIPAANAVIEYAGRMDLPDYRRRHYKKTALYAASGINCYEVFPEDQRRPYWAPRLIDAIQMSMVTGPPGRDGNKVGSTEFRGSSVPQRASLQQMIEQSLRM